jgi:hypothetical protein
VSSPNGKKQEIESLGEKIGFSKVDDDSSPGIGNVRQSLHPDAFS